MVKSEMIERGLYADDDGRIFDAYGNEYRDEDGQVCFLTKGELKVNKEIKALDEIAGILLDAQHSEKMVDTTDGEVLNLIYAVMDKYTKEIKNA